MRLLLLFLALLAGCSGAQKKLEPKPQLLSNGVCAGATIEACIERCESGKNAECRASAEALQSGIESKIDYPRAAELYELSCERTDDASCVALGKLLADGLGVEADLDRARTLYKKACARNFGEGCFLLAVVFLDGRGVDVNRETASQWLDRGCLAKHEPSCNIKMQLQAQSLPKPRLCKENDTDDCTWMCFRGNAESCQRLAAIFERGDYAKKDLPKAIELYKKACRAGDASACRAMGQRYVDGSGVESDEREAKRWFEIGCKLQDELSCERARNWPN